MMELAILSTLGVALAGAPPSPAAPVERALLDDDEGWKKVRSDERFTIYSRDQAGSDVQQARVVGVVRAGAGDLHALLGDLDTFETFFPFVERSEVLEREPGFVVVYQRSSVPLLDDRDYVVRVAQRVVEDDNRAKRYLTVWTPGPPGVGPAPDPDLIRLRDVRGRWVLEPLGPGRTRVTYSVFIDPGGAMPATLINLANRRGLPRIFEAVETEARKRAARRSAARGR